MVDSAGSVPSLKPGFPALVPFVDPRRSLRGRKGSWSWRKQRALRIGQAQHAVKDGLAGDGVGKTHGRDRRPKIVPLATSPIVSALDAVAATASSPTQNDLVSLPGFIHHHGHTGQHD